MDHTLAALTAMTAGFIAHEAMQDLDARFPLIVGALWWDTLVDAALLRERVVSVGQRDGLSRTAHFLCEAFTRFEAVGLADRHAMTMRITQIEIADALGLSPVHVNRMVKNMRDRRLITLDRSNVTILGWVALAGLGEFDPAYLHLGRKDPARPV